MQDDLKRAQAKIEQLNTMILHIGANTAEMANQYRDRIAALEAKLAETADLALSFQQETLKLAALLRECGEGLAGPNAWLERWASHVGKCHGGSLCQCGLTLARLESATTLAKIKDAIDAD